MGTAVRPKQDSGWDSLLDHGKMEPKNNHARQL